MRALRDQSLTAMIYARASKDAGGQGLSVDSQVAECNAWAGREGWTVTSVVQDNDRSASRWARLEREGWKRVLSSLGQVDVLVMWEGSRAARQMEDFSTLKTALIKAGTLLAYSGRIYDLSRSDDAFTSGLEALLAEREAGVIRERILRGKRSAAVAGSPPGFPPFGYMHLYDSQTGRRTARVPDPVTGPLVGEIADRILRGDSLSAIADDWNDRGIPGPRGGVGKWEPWRIKALITKPTVAGLRVHRGEVSGAADWEPLVEEIRWRKTLAVLEGRSRPQANPDGGRRRAQSLVSRIACCGTCGSQMTTSGGGGKKSVACVNRSCDGRASMILHKADEILTLTVEKYLETRFPLVQESRDESESRSRVDALDRQIEALKKRLSDAADAYSRSELSITVLSQIEQQLQPQIDALKQKKPRDDDQVAVVLRASHPLDAYRAAPLEVKRRVVKLLFDVRIDKARTRGPVDVRRLRVTRRRQSGA